MSVITAADVEQASGVLAVGTRDIVTPLALDRAKELGVRIERGQKNDAPALARRQRGEGRGERLENLSGRSWAPPAAVQTPEALRPRTQRLAARGESGEKGHVPFSGALYRRGAPVPGRIAVAAVASQVELRADGRPAVAVVGAGHVGAMTALRLAETSLFARVALIDIVPGLAEGLALDMWHSAGLRRFTTRIEGGADMSGLAGASYVVVTAGRPRQPGMSRTDLTVVNSEIVGGVADAVRRHAPDAVVVVVTNPLEEMTYLMARRTGFPAARVVGMAGVLDSARFCALVGLTGAARPDEVRALALGSHGAEMVIPLSLATARGQPIEEMVDPHVLTGLVERARNSGAEVVKLLQKGSAYFSPAESAASMVVSMACDRDEVIAACVQSNGAYGLADTRVGLPVRLGRDGVKEIVKLPLRPDEQAALEAAANSIAARIAELG